MSDLRAAIAGLIVLATIGFVVGTTIERNTSESRRESPAAARSEGGSSETHSEAGEQSETSHAAERGGKSAPGGSETRTAERHAELKPLGIDIEAVPFVVLAAVASLGLVAGVWRHPRSLELLGVVIAAMLLFVVLDVREIFHQTDERATGLALLAAVVAALHLAAATAAGLLARRVQRPVGPAGTIPE